VTPRGFPLGIVVRDYQSEGHKSINRRLFMACIVLANNFVVSMKISGRRSLLNYGESTSPLHQIAKMTMEKIHLLIQDTV
jgi:hypothetical protein